MTDLERKITSEKALDAAIRQLKTQETGFSPPKLAWQNALSPSTMKLLPLLIFPSLFPSAMSSTTALPPS